MKFAGFDTDKRVFIIAEAGVNHGGDYAVATRLVDVAKDAGADAVKFQAFHADRFPEPQRTICTPLEFNEWQILRTYEYAKECGILWLCTPFDEDWARQIDPIVPVFKIGSGQAMDVDFFSYVLGFGKPIIISSGKIDPWWGVGDIWLHCVSEYPTPPARANLKRMREHHMHGYSDHTGTIEIPVAAVALGARIIECHITMDRNAEGPDHTSSLEPAQFKEMVRMIRNVEKAIC